MQVEEGYECSGLQPSTCWPANTHPNTAATGVLRTAPHCVTMIASLHLHCCTIHLHFLACHFSLTLALCNQLLGCVTSMAQALSIPCVGFGLSVHTWRFLKDRTWYCSLLHLQTTVAISSPAAELVLVCRITAESTSSLYFCLFSSSRIGFIVCLWQLRRTLGTMGRYAVHHLSLHAIVSPRVANR